jgi:hypothetical protein
MWPFFLADNQRIFPAFAVDIRPPPAKTHVQPMSTISHSSADFIPILTILLVGFLFWAGLCRLGYASLHAATVWRRFLLAVVPFLFGLLGVMAKIPFGFAYDTNRLALDLGWLFVVPLWLGLVGLFRAIQESVA